MLVSAYMANHWMKEEVSLGLRLMSPLGTQPNTPLSPFPRVNTAPVRRRRAPNPRPLVSPPYFLRSKTRRNTKHDLYEFRHEVLTWLGHIVDS